MPTAVEYRHDAADRDLERRVLSFLERGHRPGLRSLMVEACNGTVTLRGQVRTFYEKQLGHDCCRRVAGVVKLIDAIDVVPGEGSTASVA